MEPIKKEVQYNTDTNLHSQKASAKRDSFIKGFLTSLILTLLACGGLYFASAFGEQKRYEFVEPDINLPELRDDVLDNVIEDEGEIEGSSADMETVDQ